MLNDMPYCVVSYRQAIGVPRIRPLLVSSPSQQTSDVRETVNVRTGFCYPHLEDGSGLHENVCVMHQPALVIC